MKKEALLLGASLLVALAITPPPASSEESLLGGPAPEFELASLDGSTVALSDFRGRLVVLHFGAGW